jgi:PLP dependent protein
MSIQLQKNIQDILENIKQAAGRAGRSPDDIRLLAVTKTLPEQAVKTALENGITLFGENRVKEAAGKYGELKNIVELHLIGHLQRNKAKLAAETFSWVQSIDKLETAAELNKYVALQDKIINILIQVNTSGESTKSGILEYGYLNSLIDEINKLENLKLRGLMTIGPFTYDKVKIRKSFCKLKELFVKVKNDYRELNIDTLSMGMSSDYEIAVEEGSTLVRIGSALFGNRG